MVFLTGFLPFMFVSTCLTFPAALKELDGLCSKEVGPFQIVIPCEGSFAYSVTRRVSTQRIFEKRYKQSYKWFIEREHLNLPSEILDELRPYFHVVHRSFFPHSYSGLVM